MPKIEGPVFNAQEILQGAENDRVERNQRQERNDRANMDERLTALLLEKYWLDIEIKEMEENAQKVNAIGTSLKKLKEKQAKLETEIESIKELLKEF